MNYPEVKIDFRFKIMAGKWHIVFDSGLVREATSVEVAMYFHIAHLNDKRIASSLPRALEKSKNVSKQKTRKHKQAKSPGR